MSGEVAATRYPTKFASSSAAKPSWCATSWQAVKGRLTGMGVVFTWASPVKGLK
jgi:hypothetical protein